MIFCQNHIILLIPVDIHQEFLAAISDIPSPAPLKAHPSQALQVRSFLLQNQYHSRYLS